MHDRVAMCRVWLSDMKEAANDGHPGAAREAQHVRGDENVRIPSDSTAS
jgi:hypothetical protein